MRTFIIVCLAGLIAAACSTTQSLPVSEVRTLDSQNHVGLYLKSGHRIPLENASHSVINEGLIRMARTVMPHVESIDRSKVVELRTSVPDTVGLEDVQSHTITEIVLRDNTLLMFDQGGARYDPQRRAFFGTLRDGTDSVAVVDLDNVSQIRTGEAELLSMDGETTESYVPEVVSRRDDSLVLLGYGGVYVDSVSVISGVLKGGVRINVPVDSISQIEVTEFSPAKTAIAVVGIPLFVAVVVAASSCPFVYSNDGEGFALDAEPLGGATVEAFKRTDFARLEHIRAKGSTYEILVRNAKDETQYLDEIKLTVVDHPRGSQVVPDIGGTLHALSDFRPPVRAYDEQGEDLTELVVEGDDRVWLTDMDRVDVSSENEPRHMLTFEFARPSESTEAYLVVNAGLSPWGANMVRNLLELRGNEVDAWYEAMNRRSSEMMKMWAFLEREELFFLKAYLQKGDTWMPVGFIAGGGPIVTEDRAIKLDLRGIEDDTVRIRVQPPFGQWKFDYIGMGFETGPGPELRELVAQSAIDQDGTSRLDELDSTDDRYYVMPSTGDYAQLSFEAPPANEVMERTVFVKVSGFYSLHLPKDRAAQHQLIEDIMVNPGRVVEYSVDEYRKAYGLRAARLP